MTRRTIRNVLTPLSAHWVGDGFPVRTLFAYDRDPEAVSPFLLLDHAGPYVFEPTDRRRGVGAHPHRGFETVTIAFDGAVAHRDSAGGGGVIRPGDVQWMTAGDGVIHEEHHDAEWATRGGRFHMVQLWVNLPAAYKRVPARYQHLPAASIPTRALDGQGRLRVVAGTLDGLTGPAATYSRIVLAEVRLEPGAQLAVPTDPDDQLLVAVLLGRVEMPAAERPSTVVADRVAVTAPGDRLELVAGPQGALLLLLGGEPIHEPIVGRGPFVMNRADELAEAFADFRAGRLGQRPPQTLAASA